MWQPIKSFPISIYSCWFMCRMFFTEHVWEKVSVRVHAPPLWVVIGISPALLTLIPSSVIIIEKLFCSLWHNNTIFLRKLVQSALLSVLSSLSPCGVCHSVFFETTTGGHYSEMFKKPAHRGFNIRDSGAAKKIWGAYNCVGQQCALTKSAVISQVFTVSDFTHHLQHYVLLEGLPRSLVWKWLSG